MRYNCRFFSCHQLAKTSFFSTFGAFAFANSLLCLLSGSQDNALISFAVATVAFACVLMIGCDGASNPANDSDQSDQLRLL